MTTSEIICFKTISYLNSVGVEGGSGIELNSSTLCCGFWVPLGILHVGMLTTGLGLNPLLFIINPALY